jgi:cytosine/adenosine deaminase-related metal-dependent hydrolase
MADLHALHQAFPGIAPAALVHMATRGGAEALDLQDLGVLEPGRRAALAYAPADEVPADPEAFLVSGIRATRVKS